MNGCLKKIIALSGLIALSALSLCARTPLIEESRKVCINFTFDKSVINPDYLQNRAAIRTLTELATDPKVYIDSIVLKPLASPEGNYEHNIALANARGQAVLELIRNLNPDLEARIGVLEGAEAWEELRECIVTDPWMSPRAKRRVLYQVYEDPRVAGKPVEMKWAIEHNLGNDTSLNNPANPTGNIWWYLYHRYYWRIRRSCICLLNIYIDVPEQDADDTPVQQDTMVVAKYEIEKEVEEAEKAVEAGPIQIDTTAVKDSLLNYPIVQDTVQADGVEEANPFIGRPQDVETTAVQDSVLNYPIVQDAVLADSVATEEPIADAVAEPVPTEEPAKVAPVAAPGKGSRQATEQPEAEEEEEEEAQQPEEAAEAAVEEVAEEQQPEETAEEAAEAAAEDVAEEQQPEEAAEEAAEETAEEADEEVAEEQPAEEPAEEATEEQPEEPTEEQPEETTEEQPSEETAEEQPAEEATNEEVAEETPATDNPSTISWNDIKNDIPKRPVTNDRARAWLDRDYEKPIPIVIPVPTPESSIL